MDDSTLQSAVEILKNCKQEHLLDFYNELDSNQQIGLVNQIVSTDFKKMQNLYENSQKDDSISFSRITPMPYIIKSSLSASNSSLYSRIGEKVIKNGELAVITLAGGKGSRLGYNGPKGAYEIDVPPKKSLFEFICDKLKKAFLIYNIYIPWYVMTSPLNDLKTKAFFEKKNYFNYPKDKIFFFTQSTLPIIDTNAKIILDNIYSIATASDGNGDVFKALASSNLLYNMQKQNIKWVSISGIDNILLDVVDPLFIGLAKSNNSSVASKSIKSGPELKDWVFANVDGLPSIVDPKNLSEDMINSKNKYNLPNYNQVNILAHLFSIDALIMLKDINLPYHRAFKKNDYINEEGMKVAPSQPNSFKFEKLIFDAFKYFKNFTLLEVEASKEFAPIKSFTGNATPETALELYLKNQKNNKL